MYSFGILAHSRQLKSTFLICVGDVIWLSFTLPFASTTKISRNMLHPSNQPCQYMCSSVGIYKMLNNLGSTGKIHLDGVCRRRLSFSTHITNGRINFELSKSKHARVCVGWVGYLAVLNILFESCSDTLHQELFPLNLFGHPIVPRWSSSGAQPRRS